MTVQTFRKNTLAAPEVQAVQLTPENGGAVWEWADSKPYVEPDSISRISGLTIFTPEGRIKADFGDWVIRDAAGKFYPCKPDTFAATYELVPGDGQ